MATKKNDPTISSDATAAAAEGTHPAVPVSEGADFAGDKKYADMPADQKDDPSTVAQIEVTEDSPAGP